MSQNVEVIRGAYDAFAGGDVPAVVAAMAPDIEWNEAENFPYADGNPYVSPQAVVEGVFARIQQDWDFWNIAIDDVLDAGDSVVVLGRYQSKNSTTGSDLDAQFAHIWWLDGGKITRFQQYADTAQVLRATGRA